MAKKKFKRQEDFPDRQPPRPLTDLMSEILNGALPTENKEVGTDTRVESLAQSSDEFTPLLVLSSAKSYSKSFSDY